MMHKRKICFVFFFLFDFFYYQIGYSGDKKPQPVAIYFDWRGQVTDVAEMEDPIKMTSKAVKVLLGIKVEHDIYVEKNIPPYVPRWQKCLKVGAFILLLPPVRKFVQAEILSNLDHYLFFDPEKIALEKQLALEEEEGKKLDQILVRQQEKLKADPQYVRQYYLFTKKLASIRLKEN